MTTQQNTTTLQNHLATSAIAALCNLNHTHDGIDTFVRLYHHVDNELNMRPMRRPEGASWVIEQMVVL
jgi:hypothetical protein